MKNKKKMVYIVIYILLFSILLKFFVSIPYIWFYNNGNNCFRNNQYELAVENYEKALQLFPTKYKECKIRINLALAILKRIEKYDIKNEKDEIINILDEAEVILFEDGCANKEDNKGHSKEAEQLKQDIEDFRKQLQYEEDKKDDKKDNKKEDEKKSEEKKEQEIREIQQQSIEERQKEMDTYTQMSNYEYYPGKKW